MYLINTSTGKTCPTGCYYCALMCSFVTCSGVALLALTTQRATLFSSSFVAMYVYGTRQTSSKQPVLATIHSNGFDLERSVLLHDSVSTETLLRELQDRML